MLPGPARQAFRAVFLNCLLDCLPAAVLELDGDNVLQLSVRTCVARNVRLAAFSDQTAQALAARAQRTDAQAHRDLLAVYGLFASEYDHRPMDGTTVSDGGFAVDLARRSSKRSRAGAVGYCPVL